MSFNPEDRTFLLSQAHRTQDHQFSGRKKRLCLSNVISTTSYRRLYLHGYEYSRHTKLVIAHVPDKLALGSLVSGQSSRLGSSYIQLVGFGPVII